MHANGNPPRTASKNKLLNGFYPMAVLARLFGYFPFTTFGSKLSLLSELKTVKLKIDIILTIANLAIVIYFTFPYYLKWPNFFYTAVRNNVHNYYFMGYRLISGYIIIHFAVFKCKTLVNLFQQTCLSEYVCDKWNLVYNKKLKILSICLVILPLANIALYLATAIDYYLDNYPFQSFAEEILTFYSLACTIYGFNFASSLSIYFNCYFQWRFLCLSDDLKAIVTGEKCGDTVSDNFILIRKRHEILVTLVEKVTDVLSPALLMYIAAEFVAICVNAYEFCATAGDRAIDYTVVAGNVAYVLIRLLPLIFVCITSNTLLKSATNGVQHINGMSCTDVSKECDFQAAMLLDQFLNRRALLTASGMLTVNHKLIAKAAAIIITYNVLMMEASISSK
ncbi:hypothetical protein CHUAL_003944 [Chamberlinius hualienensis]